MRTIDADVLVMEIIENLPVYNTNRVVDVINSQPTVGGWISVKDRTPKWSGLYLATLQDMVVCVALYDGKDDTWYNEDMGYLNTTHWMPLPEPPEEVSVK